MVENDRLEEIVRPLWWTCLQVYRCLYIAYATIFTYVSTWILHWASANVWVLRCALAASMCAWVELDPERHPSDKDGVIRLGGYLVELLSLSLSRPSSLISCTVYFFEQCAVTEKFPCRWHLRKASLSQEVSTEVPKSFAPDECVGSFAAMSRDLPFSLSPIFILVRLYFLIVFRSSTIPVARVETIDVIRSREILLVFFRVRNSSEG